MLKAVIFDMDGVIIDSEPMYLKVNQEIFLQYGLTISTEEYGTLIGLSNRETWTLIKDKYHLAQTVEELVQTQLRGNMEYLKRGNEKPIPGILQLLESLSERNITIALASSSPEEVIHLVLATLHIAGYFHVAVSGESLPHSKPAPDIFLHVAKNLKISPQDCVVIEDSRNGVIAAKTAGMTCIGYQNKNSFNQDLSEADLVVDNLEILDVDMLEKI